MRALLYDVHGNLPALEAVLTDARAAGAERFLLGGDYAFAGAFPEETIERLDSLEADRLRGNGERWTGDPSAAPDDPWVQRALAWCRQRLGEERTAALASLPETHGEGEVLFCHASPHSDLETFLPEPAPEEERLLAGADAKVLVFGHSHLQFRRHAGDRLLVNPGSVGMPFDGDRRAAYTLWDGRRTFEPRRVEYDADGYVAAVQERMAEIGKPLETLVRRLEQAAFVD